MQPVLEQMQVFADQEDELDRLIMGGGPPVPTGSDPDLTKELASLQAEAAIEDHRKIDALAKENQRLREVLRAKLDGMRAWAAKRTALARRERQRTQRRILTLHNHIRLLQARLVRQESVRGPVPDAAESAAEAEASSPARKRVATEQQAAKPTGGGATDGDIATGDGSGEEGGDGAGVPSADPPGTASGVREMLQEGVRMFGPAMQLARDKDAPKRFKDALIPAIRWFLDFHDLAIPKAPPAPDPAQLAGAAAGGGAGAPAPAAGSSGGASTAGSLAGEGPAPIAGVLQAGLATQLPEQQSAPSKAEEFERRLAALRGK